MTRILLALFLSAALLSPQSTKSVRRIQVPRKIALVIGNAAYAGQSPLHNTRNDAADMAKTLRGLGFDQVTDKYDLNNNDLDVAINGFVEGIHKGDLAFFYFSGHGLSLGEENYLLPVDFQAEGKASMERRAYPASWVRDKMESAQARLRVLVLDACRNNPYGKAKGTTGLKRMESREMEGTLIAYATNHGNTAAETDGRNSRYTGYLLEALRDPQTHLLELFREVQAQVYDATDKQQFPYLYAGVVGEFYFKAPAVARVSGEEEAWNEVKDSRRADLLRGFIDAFPGSPHVPTARLKIAALEPKVADRVEVERPAQGKRVNPKDGLTYVWIPPGQFMMGCSPGDTECYDDEKPPRAVNIDRGFYLSESEVTQAAYEKVTGKKPSYFRGAKRPVETVAWNDAVGYCQAVGGRLPTEEEWEYAARAGTTGARYGELSRIAWYNDNSGAKTHDVKQKNPNTWGLYDMLGNVWEWTASGDEKTNALRGGSWFNQSPESRSSVRDEGVPSAHFNLIGVRCAWE